MLKKKTLNIIIWITQMFQNCFCQERINPRDWITHIGLIPKVIPLKLFLDHFRFWKSQENLDIANPVSRILLTQTAYPASIHFWREHPSNALGTHDNIARRPDTFKSKTDLRGITFVRRPVWGIQSLSLVLSCFCMIACNFHYRPARSD